MRSFLTLLGPSILETIPKLHSIAKKFSELTGNISLREDSDLIQGKYDLSSIGMKNLHCNKL